MCTLTVAAVARLRSVANTVPVTMACVLLTRLLEMVRSHPCRPMLTVWPCRVSPTSAYPAREEVSFQPCIALWH